MAANAGGKQYIKNPGKNIATRVREAIEQPVSDAGYSIWDVTFYKDVSEMVLEVSIDKKDGPIGTDDCMAVTNIVDPILDEMDPIEDSYSLMVSGGGYIRDLRLDEHIDYAIANGYPVVIRTFVSVSFENLEATEEKKEQEEAKTGNKKGKAKSKETGSKQWEGKILSYDDNLLELETDAGKIKLDRKLISKITAICDERGRAALIPSEDEADK